MENVLKLAQFLNSKLCHELAGLIGAVNNCIELTQIPQQAAQHTAKKLLDINAKKLVSAIKFYRLLYGFVNVDEEINLNDLKSLINDIAGEEKIPIFKELIDEPIPINIAKIIMGLYICAKGNITKQGEIVIALNIVKNNFVIKIKVVGENLKVKENKSHFLLQETNLDDLNVENVHEAYMFYLCSQQNFAINLNHLNHSIEYIIKKKQG